MKVNDYRYNTISVCLKSEYISSGCTFVAGCNDDVLRRLYEGMGSGIYGIALFQVVFLLVIAEQ